jgi:hypothetical protein
MMVSTTTFKRGQVVVVVVPFSDHSEKNVDLRWSSVPTYSIETFQM